MSESEFTKGPWSVYTRRGSEMFIGPSHNCTVASVCFPPVGDAFANASLIAAAPELLEALQFMERNSLRADWPEDIYSAMVAAIAKATGAA